METDPIACAPVKHVMRVADVTLTVVQFAPPTETVAPDKKFEPISAIAVLPVILPALGNTLLKVGAEFVVNENALVKLAVWVSLLVAVTVIKPAA